ncbi:MAG: sigma factor-like helix-turn-helix DNA-binding protein [Spirochaetaceae bacterium]|jgi:deoxyribonucleoside regulator|nr:sigma factor-like helix-turn-helix DNA-binding protein [Spirochaetaceae bacterium]
MIDREEHQMILNVAVRYYLEDKTQSQIGKELYMSRSKVSRLLKKGRTNNIIEINIRYESEEFELLQSRIKLLFDVQHVYITKTVSDETTTLQEVCKKASKELEKRLHDDITLGISWGRHIDMLSRFLAEHDYHRIRIVELFGAMGSQINKVDTQSVSRRICDKLNASLYPLPAPIFIVDEAGRQEVMNSYAVRSTLQKIDECELILTSIGTIEGDPQQTLWHEYLKDEMKEEVRMHKGVGFILAHFFNRDGKFFKSLINDSVIGIETEKIKDKKIFAIASGKNKTKAILGALRGGFLNTLVSDEETLRLVVKLAEEAD